MVGLLSQSSCWTGVEQLLSQLSKGFFCHLFIDLRAMDPLALLSDDELEQEEEVEAAAKRPRTLVDFEALRQVGYGLEAEQEEAMRAQESLKGVFQSLEKKTKEEQRPKVVPEAGQRVVQVLDR